MKNSRAASLVAQQLKKQKSYYRRKLPHYHPPDGTMHVVFRLAGSLPPRAIEDLRSARAKRETMIASIKSQKHKYEEWLSHHEAYFAKFDTLLDGNTTGPRWLADSRVAEIVAEAIHFRDKRQYGLLAFTIMPNHVHIVCTVGRPDWASYKSRHKSSTTLSDILENLKWYTALKCNRILERTGQFWQHESYDHVIRDGEELERTLWYVLYNPVRAKLVETWERWQWTYLKPETL